jgi:hypothetical protein
MIMYCNMAKRLFPEIDLSGSLILRWIITAEGRLSGVEDRKGVRFVEINAQTIIEHLPALGSAHRTTIYRKIDKLVGMGALERKNDSKKSYFVRPSDRAMLTIHGQIESAALPGYSDVAKCDNDDVKCDNDVAKYDIKRCRKMRHDNLLYKINNIYRPNRVKRPSLTDTASDVNDSKTDEVEEAFDRFWKLYPKRVKKQSAFKRFKSKKLHRRIDDLLKAVGHYVKSPRVADAILQKDFTYIPHPATWLNDWEEWVNGDPEAASANAAVVAVETPRRTIADRRLADLMGRLHKAFDEIGDDADAEVLPSALPQARYFKPEELAVMDEYNESVPFIYEVYTAERYAKFILGKIDERSGYDGAA